MLANSKTRRLGALNLTGGLLTTWLLWRFEIIQRVLDWKEPAVVSGIPMPNWIEGLKSFILFVPPVVAFAGLWQLVSGRSFMRLLLIWERMPYWIQITIVSVSVAVVLGIAGLLFLRILNN
jgi:hypothetical protein